MKKILKKVTRQVHHRLKRACRQNRFPNPCDIDTEDLRGGCAIGAVMVAQRLRNRGFEAIVIEGYDDFEGHAWVEVNGYICDPTYQQFDIQKPWLVEPVNRSRQSYCWEEYTTDPNFQDWCWGQSPLGNNGQLFIRNNLLDRELVLHHV